MKQLIIARHAKSSRTNLFCSDSDRWLNKRGKTDLARMAQILVRDLKKPMLIIASPAKRTKKTARAYAIAWWMKKKHIKREPSIYEASLATLLRCIESTDEKTGRLMLVGHNPWLTELLNYCGYQLDNLPTCGVVVLQYKGEFRGNFEQQKCAFIARYFPKEVG